MTDKISNWESMVMTEAEKVGNKFDNIELDCGTHAEAFGMGAGFAVKKILSFMQETCSYDYFEREWPHTDPPMSAIDLLECVKEFITR